MASGVGAARMLVDVQRFERYYSEDPAAEVRFKD